MTRNTCRSRLPQIESASAWIGQILVGLGSCLTVAGLFTHHRRTSKSGAAVVLAGLCFFCVSYLSFLGATR